MYPTLVALNCLGRTCCINAATTARGMQQVGLLFVLSPALRWLYPEGAARARAFARYGGHSNTHPFMIPLFVGILLSLEEEIAKGTLPESAVSSVRETLATTLSALGDSFFSGTLLPLWALVSVALLLSGHIPLAGFLAVGFFFALLVFRAGRFFFCLPQTRPRKHVDRKEFIAQDRIGPQEAVLFMVQEAFRRWFGDDYRLPVPGP